MTSGANRSFRNLVPTKAEALTVLALDRLMAMVKRADHSLLLWSGCSLSLRSQTLVPLASRRAPAVQGTLPVLPPAPIDSSGPRCRAQWVGAAVVSAPCQNPARRDLMRNCGVTIQKLKAQQDAHSPRTRLADQKGDTSMMCPPRRSRPEARSDHIDVTLGNQVETSAPCRLVARIPGVAIERPEVHTRADLRRIRNPSLRGVADQEGGAPPMRRRSRSSVKVRNEPIVRMTARQIGNHACRVLMTVPGVPTAPLKARKEPRSQRIRNPCLGGVMDQEAGAPTVFTRTRPRLRTRSAPIELIMVRPIWNLTRHVRMAAGGVPIERPNARKQAGWCRIANPSLA